MAAKNDSEEWQKIYRQRMAFAEPAFAKIRVRVVINGFTPTLPHITVPY